MFVFFGLLSVLGSNFLYSKTFSTVLVLPAITIGCLSVAVLNLNNMRDVENDTICGKQTIVVKIGLKKAKIYHFTLLLLSVICMFVFLVKNKLSFIVLIGFLPIVIHAIKVAKISTFEEFNPELKKVALSTFVISMLFF